MCLGANMERAPWGHDGGGERLRPARPGSPFADGEGLVVIDHKPRARARVLRHDDGRVRRPTSTGPTATPLFLLVRFVSVRLVSLHDRRRLKLFEANVLARLDVGPPDGGSAAPANDALLAWLLAANDALGARSDDEWRAQQPGGQARAKTFDKALAKVTVVHAPPPARRAAAGFGQRGSNQGGGRGRDGPSRRDHATSPPPSPPPPPPTTTTPCDVLVAAGFPLLTPPGAGARAFPRAREDVAARLSQREDSDRATKLGNVNGAGLLANAPRGQTGAPQL